MPIDPSIYSNSQGAKPIDIGSLINTARGALQYQGESSLGDIYQQATNPDGTVDAGKLGSLASKAGVLAPQVAAQAQARAQGQQVIDRGKMDNLRQWWGTLDSTIYPLLNKQDLSHKDVLNAVHGLIGHQDSELNGGIFDPKLAVQTAKEFYGPDGKPLPVNKIREKLAQFHSRVLDHIQQSEYVQTGVGPDGQALYKMRNGAILEDAMKPRGAATAQPGATSAPPAAPAAPGATPAPAPGPAGPVAAAQPGGPSVAFTPPLGAQESSNVMQADLARAGTFSDDLYPLNQALDLAKKLGPGGMGPGSKGRQEFESFLYGLAPSLVPPEMRDKIKTYAELEKYLINNASQRAQNLGPHTNDGLAAATTGSPNVHINDLAGVDLIKAQIGLRRMEHVRTLENSKKGPVAYLGEKSKWGVNQDPRAYMIDMMTPEQVKKLHDSLKGEDRKRFNNSLRAAIESGVVAAPEAQSAAR